MSTTITMDNLAYLQLFNLISPALPIGSFAYSQGLEYAIDQQLLKTDIEVSNWVSDVLINSIGKWDCPCLKEMANCINNQDPAGFDHWNNLLLASRESRELWLEDLQVGKALKKY